MQSYFPWCLEFGQPFNWLRKTFFEKPEPEQKWRAVCILLPAILIWFAGATLSSVYEIIIIMLFTEKATLYCLFGLICTSCWILLSLSLSLSLNEYFCIMSSFLLPNLVSTRLVASMKISESDVWSFNRLLKPVSSAAVASLAEFEQIYLYWVVFL